MKHMVMWVIYKNPSDYPGKIVARKWLVTGEGVMATNEVLKASTIEPLSSLRQQFMKSGMKLVPRDRSDDSCVVESWM